LPPPPSCLYDPTPPTPAENPHLLHVVIYPPSLAAITAYLSAVDIPLYPPHITAYTTLGMMRRMTMQVYVVVAGAGEDMVVSVHRTFDQSRFRRASLADEGVASEWFACSLADEPISRDDSPYRENRYYSNEGLLGAKYNWTKKPTDSPTPAYLLSHLTADLSAPLGVYEDREDLQATYDGYDADMRGRLNVEPVLLFKRQP
jgi:hypothetical protein